MSNREDKIVDVLAKLKAVGIRFLKALYVLLWIWAGIFIVTNGNDLELLWYPATLEGVRIFFIYVLSGKLVFQPFRFK